MKVFVARHGKTNENAKGNMSGNSNHAQLIEEGLKHAENLALFLKDKGIKKIFCSPLDRASDTASKVVSELGIPIEKDKRLVEMEFGLMDGKSEEGEAKEHLDKRKKDLSHKFPEGESYEDLIERVDDFLKDLFSEDLEKVLVVGHGGINRTLLSRLLKLDLSNPENLTHINVDNPIVYSLDTETKEVNWKNTLTGEEGEGLLR
tara:strand:- start:518 stop:1129 length:612 start_codon:yes stop_codon:yes gene_type:complete